MQKWKNRTLVCNSKQHGLKIVGKMNMSQIVEQGIKQPCQHKQLGYQKKNPMNVNAMFYVWECLQKS